MVQLISFVDENVEPNVGMPVEEPNLGGEPAVGAALAGGTAAVLARWYRLRNGCRFPAWSELEQCLHATNWPDSIVIDYRGKDDALALETMDSEISGASDERLVRESSESMSKTRINLSSTMLQWVRAVAGEAVRVGRPLADTEAFPSSTGDLRYRAFALPFTSHQTDCYRVICHLHRVS